MLLLRLAIAIFWTACIFMETGVWTAGFALATYVAFEVIAWDLRTSEEIRVLNAEKEKRDANQTTLPY
jgi:hypothetical protein